MRNVKRNKAGSNIASHAWSHDHKIYLEGGKVIDKGSYRKRKTLESWHTARIPESDNNSKQLPEQYSIIPDRLSH